MKPKCVVLLSEKSSGSSACQNVLAKAAGIRHVEKTRHFENETLYWTKAASVLGLPQLDMVDSEVPIPARKAREDLLTLLQDNLGSFTPTGDDEAWIMEGWRQLCVHYAPVFLEKSPHHIFQKSALELLVKCADQCADVDFLFVGLVRNPMDTIYSQWSRWGTDPDVLEHQWCVGYENLAELRSELGERFALIRYEDMVSSMEAFEPVLKFCEVSEVNVDDYLHRRALQKWREDRLFGFTLSSRTIELAKQYGYERADMANDGYRLWPLVKHASRARRRVTQRAKRRVKAILQSGGQVIGQRL